MFRGSQCYRGSYVLKLLPKVFAHCCDPQSSGELIYRENVTETLDGASSLPQEPIVFRALFCLSGAGIIVPSDSVLCSISFWYQKTKHCLACILISVSFLLFSCPVLLQGLLRSPGGNGTLHAQLANSQLHGRPGSPQCPQPDHNSGSVGISSRGSRYIGRGNRFISSETG